MVTCCGEERTAPFCPDCGRQLYEPNPIQALAAYCRKRALLYEQKMASTEQNKSQASPAAWTKWEENGLLKTRATAERWRSWSDALAKVLEQLPPSGG